MVLEAVYSIMGLLITAHMVLTQEQRLKEVDNGKKSE
jgi:hypothetical protein